MLTESEVPRLRSGGRGRKEWQTSHFEGMCNSSGQYRQLSRGSLTGKIQGQASQDLKLGILGILNALKMREQKKLWGKPQISKPSNT